jgi:hypothetical protein
LTNRPTRPVPHYVQEAVRLATAKGITTGVHHVVVEHDDLGPMLNGGKTCNCEPTATLCEGET